ncbi:MAG TPA: TusE/DsrC/DsvC family sulfur relay protein [Bacteroidota bacterium]|nr:TusE/DsrC/DsvC family sulfur relay protein [Bacteroidota bacterium]
MTLKQFGSVNVEVDDDGHLANGAIWSEDLARDIAKEEGIESLTDRHWLVINYMRKEFQAKGDAPSLRKLTKESGVDTKELYALFPKGPAKKAAKIAGLPKPKGCI